MKLYVKDETLYIQNSPRIKRSACAEIDLEPILEDFEEEQGKDIPETENGLKRV